MGASAEDDSFYNLSPKDFTVFTNGSIEPNNLLDINESEKLKGIREAQEKHEFICLDHYEHKVILTEGKALLSQLEQYNKTLPTTATETETTTTTFSLNDNVFVVSFLGDTASGKSFLANDLLGVQSFAFGENEHNGSTTANVTCFKSNSILNIEKNNCFVLDFEGENGSRLPSLLKRFVDYIFLPDEEKDRREAVGKYFPTLAYLLSNVIILMSQDDLFANSRYIDRIEKFTAKAVGNVQQNMHKPLLILVQNKYAGEYVLTPKQATAKFFYAHPNAMNLYHFFSNVRCVILPFKRIETTPNINEKFDAQVTILRKLLVASCEQHQNHMLPHLPWILLTRHVIEKLSKNEIIMKHMVLQSIFIEKQSKDEDTIIKLLFNKLYGKKKIHSTRWFHYCRNFAMDVLARSIAIRCSLYPVEKIAKFIEKECESRLIELWKLLDGNRPCEALYMGRGYIKDRNRPVFCYQHKAVHKDNNKHQTSEAIYGASWLRVFVDLFVDLPTIDIWNGSFHSSDKSSDTPAPDMYQKLLTTTNDYLNELKQNDRGKYTTYKRLLQKWNIEIEFEQMIDWNTCFCCFGPIMANDETHRILGSSICSACREGLQMCPEDFPAESIMPSPTLVDNKECAICMAAPLQASFIPCGHYYYCEPCAKRIFNSHKACAVCKQKVTSIQKIYTSQ